MQRPQHPFILKVSCKGYLLENPEPVMLGFTLRTYPAAKNKDGAGMAPCAAGGTTVSGLRVVSRAGLKV